MIFFGVEVRAALDFASYIQATVFTGLQLTYVTWMQPTIWSQ